MSNRTLGVVTSTSFGGNLGTEDRYVSFAADLDDGETLTGTPVVTTTHDSLTIGSPTVNSAEIVDGNITVAIGEAVEFRVTPTLADETATAALLVSCATTDSNRKTRNVYQPIAPSG